MDMQLIQLILALALLAYVGIFHAPRLWQRWQVFKRWEAQQHALEAAGGVAAWNDPAFFQTAEAIVSPPTVEPVPVVEPLEGAGRALKNPPQDIRVVLQKLMASEKTGEYMFPIGWKANFDGRASLIYGSFVGDTNHILTTGFTDSGKDSWAQGTLLSLAIQYAPTKLQLAIIDGKGGLSWIGWKHKEHVWLMAEQPTEIAPAMEALRAERERRQKKLYAAECEKWEEYAGGDLPLLVVYVSELMLLQGATSKTELADWLNEELSSARASGIRYIVSAQTVTRMDTRWRSQIGLYVAGYQPRSDADEPNTSFTTKELREMGTLPSGHIESVPPSAIPVPPVGAGVFTCVQGRTVLTVRSSYLPADHRRWVLSQLPDKPKNALQPLVMNSPVAATKSAQPAVVHSDQAMLLHLLQTGQPLPLSDEPVAPATAAQKAVLQGFASATNAASLMLNGHDHGVVAPSLVAPDEVPIEEQNRIVAAAKNVSSRGKLCQELYGVRGGQKYTWVQKVCDAAGLLMPQEQAAA